MYNVLKRTGKLVEFDLGKINQAITLAFEAQGREFNPNMIDFLALKVTADFEPKIKDHSIAVEDIQDSVENVLVQAGYSDVAKAYILYRAERNRVRDVNSRLIKTLKDITGDQTIQAQYQGEFAQPVISIDTSVQVNIILPVGIVKIERMYFLF